MLERAPDMEMRAQEGAMPVKRVAVKKGAKATGHKITPC
jgi:hypothetical protein